MYIFNIRKGFATNSSSSHSILVLPNIDNKISTNEYLTFELNSFVLADQKSKENYFAIILKHNLEKFNFNKKEINKYLKGIFGEGISERIKNASIDHQSVITFPRTWDNKSLNKEFIIELAEYIKRPNIIVVGNSFYNNIDNYLKNNYSESPLNNLLKDSNGDHYIARKENDYWTIFNRRDGTKLRFSFTSEVAPEKSIAPELVDIKITDYCPYACKFCYQDSTLKGKHASLENIKKIADELEKAQVFEVALGGGETTLHPHFEEILKIFKQKNIIPNFTTKNLNFLRQKNTLNVIENCGAMAFSIQSAEDVRKVQSALIDCKKYYDIETPANFYIEDSKKTNIWRPKINFQVVMGSIPMEEFKKILNIAPKICKRITLLGYKENGRGKDFAPYDYSDWLNIIEETKKKSPILEISIDTALASEFEQELLNKKVDPVTFHTTEGAFSAYIDAVKMTIAPSSYVGLEQTQPFDENWLEKYKNMKAKPERKRAVKI